MVESSTEAAVAEAEITIDGVEAILAEHGYDVSEHDLPDGGSVLRVRDPESGVVLRGVLEGDILFLTISCLAVEKSKITPELMQRMLDAGNGISTSSFQLYDRADGKTAVTLNNFCKLQTLGDDDRDDILSCVEFLMVDVMAAREIVGDLA